MGDVRNELCLELLTKDLELEVHVALVATSKQRLLALLKD